jgi:hypothetical protein
MKAEVEVIMQAASARTAVLHSQMQDQTETLQNCMETMQSCIDLMHGMRLQSKHGEKARKEARKEARKDADAQKLEIEERGLEVEEKQVEFLRV